MATVSISQLDTATQAKVDDLYEVAVVDENSQTGYASRKLTAAQIATLFAQGVQFSGLSTAAKTIIAAINEAAQNVGSEVEPNPVGEPTDTLEKIGIDGTVYEVGGGSVDPVSKTATGNPISITDGAAAPIVSGVVTFEPVQEGSGIPSPENIRPITGYDDCEVEVTDDPTSPTVTNTYTIDLDGTRYGGKVNTVSGVMNVNRVKATGLSRGSLDSSRLLYRILFTNAEVIKAWSITTSPTQYIQNSHFDILSLKDSRLSTAPSIAQHEEYLYIGGYVGKENELDSLLSSLDLIYELATPFTVQLTPEQIRTIEGTNNISTNMTDMSLEYITQDYQPLVELIEMSAGHHYSTQERVVGTWIDGKPLYEKVFSVTLPTFEYNQWTIIDSAELSNVLELVVCQALKNTSSQLELPSNFAVLGALNNNNKLQIMNLRNANYGQNIPARIIVQYTKTTD